MTAAAATSWTEPVLDISDFSVAYRTAGGDVRAVDHVNLTLHAGEVVGLAGESGSGKSTLAYGACRLLRPPALITGGTRQLQRPPHSSSRWKSPRCSQATCGGCAGGKSRSCSRAR